MNGVTNGSDPGLALQGLTVQGSNNNNNPDNRPVEDPAQRRGKVLGNLSFSLSLSLTDSLYLTRNMCFAIAVPFCLFYQPGQIIDIRSMINEATKLNAEEGMDGQVSKIY